MSTECPHDRIRIEAMDQTLGLVCLGCDLVVYCWMDEHVPERLWNRACEDDPGGNPCKQDRDNVCALCEAEIEEVTS